MSAERSLKATLDSSRRIVSSWFLHEPDSIIPLRPGHKIRVVVRWKLAQS